MNVSFLGAVRASKCGCSRDNGPPSATPPSPPAAAACGSFAALSSLSFLRKNPNPFFFGLSAITAALSSRARTEAQPWPARYRSSRVQVCGDRTNWSYPRFLGLTATRPLGPPHTRFATRRHTTATLPSLSSTAQLALLCYCVAWSTDIAQVVLCDDEIYH